MTQEFREEDLKKLYRPGIDSSKGRSGQITIIGGSSLFHGAPILALKTAARIVDMVFFASPEPSVGKVAEQLKSQLSSFIWVPWEHVEEYLEKSEAVLIGPGLMRYHKDQESSCDEACQQTKEITESFLQSYPGKQWVIDAGSLQTMNPDLIPQNAILTPNLKEFEILFEMRPHITSHLSRITKQLSCIILLKSGKQDIVCSPGECLVITGGNVGLAKGGTGDVLAGLTVALAAKNPAFLAACAASFIVKKAADELYKKVGFAYSADDLAEKIPKVLGEYFR